MCVCALDPKLELDALGAAQGWSNRPQFAAVHMSLAGTERRASKLPWPLRFHSGLGTSTRMTSSDMRAWILAYTNVLVCLGLAVAMSVPCAFNLGRYRD